MPYTIPIQVDCDMHDADQHYVHYGHLPNPGPLAPLQYGWHETPGRYGYGPTVRDHFLVHFIMRGKGKVVVRNKEYQIGEGQCFAIFPHQITYYEADAQDPWMYYWIGFEGQWAEEMMGAAGLNDNSIAVHIPHADQVVALLRGLSPHMAEADFFLMLTGQLHTLFYYLRRRHTSMRPVPFREVPTPMPNEYVRILLSIIETSYSERISVSALAQRLRLNRCYMTDLFRKHTGLSIKAYLHEYRLQRALLKLQHPKNTIKSIALESGFRDQLYFSRAFRERFGLSPQQYRAAEKIGKT